MVLVSYKRPSSNPPIIYNVFWKMKMNKVPIVFSCSLKKNHNISLYSNLLQLNMGFLFQEWSSSARISSESYFSVNQSIKIPYTFNLTWSNHYQYAEFAFWTGTTCFMAHNWGYTGYANRLLLACVSAAASYDEWMHHFMICFAIYWVIRTLPPLSLCALLQPPDFFIPRK